MKKLILLLLTLKVTAAEPNQILYLLQKGHSKEAFENYNEYTKTTGKHDTDLLHQMGLMILHEGYMSTDPEIQFLTLFGAGISLNERALYILEDGIKNSNPKMQAVAMNFLAAHPSTRTTEALYQALSSPFLQIRVEALSYFAQMKHPKAVGLIESLMQKVPPELHPFFPPLFAMVENADSTKMIQKLTASSDEKVRIQAILCIAKHHRDDLLSQVRIIATHHNVSEQEACAFTLGKLKDDHSLQKLQELSRSPSVNVKLAALKALYDLGNKEAKEGIVALAKVNDPFAITILGQIPGSEGVLYPLLSSSNLQTRINAALALLSLEDSRSLPLISELLIRDSRDIACSKVSTPGGGLTSYKIIPSARQNLQEDLIAFEIFLKTRENILEQTLNLPEKDFLALANNIFESNQNDLIPLLAYLLENHQSPGSIELLKKHSEKIGAPLVRGYCNLALFRMKEEGPYAAALREWILTKQDQNLIQFRPFLTWELRENEGSQYYLTPEDSSRLLVDSFQAFAEKRDEAGLDVLLQAIQYGNAKNKYALAGLLMRTIE